MTIGDVSQIVAAGGTVLLAGFTAFLAFQTKNMVSKTDDAVERADRELLQGQDMIAAAKIQASSTDAQAAASQRIVDASFQPVLVPVIDRELKHNVGLTDFNGETTTLTQLGAAPVVFTSGVTVWCVVPVRNIGPGVALLPPSQDTAVLKTHIHGGVVSSGRPTGRVMGPGDVIDVVFHGNMNQAPGLVASGSASGETIDTTVAISYRDLLGRVTRSEFKYKFDGPQRLLDVEFILPTGSDTSTTSV